MATTKVNFRVDNDVLKVIDDDAAADHRDRTSMLHKIIGYYYQHNKPLNGHKPASKKKGTSK